MKYFILFIISIAFSSQLTAQDIKEEARFSLVVHGGLFFPGYTGWKFYNMDYAPTRSEGMISIGVQYGAIARVRGTLLNLSLDVGYGQIGAVKQKQLNNAEMMIQRLPIIMWYTVETENIISPYVEIGSGVCRTDFRELYTNPHYPSVRFHHWNFCWGYAAGLRYRCSDKFDIALSVRHWVTEEKITEQNSWGDNAGINGPYGDSPAGLCVTIHL
jgi:opacity protein-like surface antigen